MEVMSLSGKVPTLIGTTAFVHKGFYPLLRSFAQGAGVAYVHILGETFGFGGVWAFGHELLVKGSIHLPYLISGRQPVSWSEGRARCHYHAKKRKLSLENKRDFFANAPLQGVCTRKVG